MGRARGMDAVLTSVGFVAVLVGISLAVVLWAVYTELRFVADSWIRIQHQAASLPNRAALRGFDLQQVIGVMLVSVGVILEGRGTFLGRVVKRSGVAADERQEALTEACEVFGFYLLIVGLFVELLGEIPRFAPTQPMKILVTAATASTVMNGIACYLFLRLIAAMRRLPRAG